MSRFLLAFLLILTGISAVQAPANAQAIRQTKGDFVDKFRPLDEALPTPNQYRAATGAPGESYWQQKADYVIKAKINDDDQTLDGSQTITYTNNSPYTLKYLWLQLDQNRFRIDSIANLTASPRSKTKITYGGLRAELERDFGGGHNITAVKDSTGKDIPYTIVGTMMRVDLLRPLGAGQRVRFSVDWNFKLVDGRVQRARSGYELFEEDGNYIYGLAQWYPRLAAFSDYDGWHTKEFLGSGEFALEFGDYQVEITVPADHIVASTGELQNARDVLTAEQRQRLTNAATAETPQFIVTKDEAVENEKSKADGTKTWIFKAQNVRDFAFASSRKFVWDAQGYKQNDGRTIMGMSFYPKEGMPLWDKYSTHSVIHTIEVYDRFTFNYPYPTAISVNGVVGGGMEYPMISFNGPRPNKDDKVDEENTYSRRTKYSLISVVIHETGHNYFPMIVNSDERRWTWMDEGLNTFLQFVAEREWEEKYPAFRGEPKNIVDYMKSPRQVPIMTQSDSVLQLGNNAYAKPATALNILRETIMGRELFDFAFREYAQRWKFKRPTPADFFRTMEDASGVDLDWFWRGWFYTTDHVDISIDSVTQMKIDTKDPDVEEPYKREKKDEEPESLTMVRNDEMTKRTERFPELEDIYNENDRYTVTEKQREKYNKTIEKLEDWEKELLSRSENIYMMDFTNRGGLPMPVLLEVTYTDDTTEEIRIPAEIWRAKAKSVSKMLVTEKEIAQVLVDPHWETADINIENNYFPRRIVPSRLELYKFERGKSRNLMKDLLVEKQEKEKAEEEAAKADEAVGEGGDTEADEAKAATPEEDGAQDPAP